jgi:23S rRNA (guanosine2251-2'-O)-methyltransferase
LLKQLKADGFAVAALEQSATSQQLQKYTPPQKVALVLGREVEGIDESLLAACDTTLEIPMFGKKESFNVVQAAAMALYQCRFAAEQ